MWAAFRTATRHRLVRHAVGTGVVVISIVERSGVARENALVQALPLSSWRLNYRPFDTIPTRFRQGRTPVRAARTRSHRSANRRPNRHLGRSACDRASGCRRVLAGLPQPSGLEIGHVPRERSPGQRRPRSRIAKPAGANRAAATAPLKPLPTTTAWKSPSRATPAHRLRGCEVKAKGQQADLSCLRRTSIVGISASFADVGQ